MNEGFYKLENGTLLYAPNYVLNKHYEMYKENHLDYQYPIDSWYWFDEEDAAYSYFQLSKEE